MNPIQFLGASPPTPVITLDGRETTARRVYLDSAATCPMPVEVFATLGRYLELSCANSHTNGSASGRATTAALNQAHQLVGELVGYDPAKHAVVFNGNGATGPLNLAASIIFPNESRPIAIVSGMEHHSNMLPWTRAADVLYIRTLDDGTLDMAHLRELLAINPNRVAVIAVSALSNVTGIGTDINAIAALAHAAGVLIVVDASQAASHIALRMGEIDFMALSGHKLYAPGSPGVLVARRDLLERGRWRCACVGGGTVQHVGLGKNEVELKRDIVEVFEAGTPNIPGEIILGAAVRMLMRIGMPAVRAHELELVRIAMPGLTSIDGVVVYGPQDVNARTGILSFNLRDVSHGLMAAALNDYWGIAVRNDCFCAQPYVRALLDARCNVDGVCMPINEKRRGMVRASFGLITTPDDVRLLVQAVRWIAANKAAVAAQYEQDAEGEFRHRTFRPRAVFEL